MAGILEMIDRLFAERLIDKLSQFTEYNINITGMDLSKANELKSVIRGELDNHDKQLA